MSRRVEKAEHVGEMTACTLFATMVNAKYRGPAFRWESFEDMAVRVAKAQVGTAFSTEEWEKFEDEITRAAERGARRRAKECLAASGML